MMVDETLYIVVDNQKIYPMRRSPRSDSATADRTGRDDRTFGVVDRVTISKAAREKARVQQAQNEGNPTAIEDLSKRPFTTTGLLTYSPKQLQP